MRWMWIDRVTELEPGRRMVAVKNVSLAEEHLHVHFPADAERGLGAMAVMPASLIIEGMAQTAGILVGHAEGFRERVILAKIAKAEIVRDVPPGVTIRHTAEIERMDGAGASTKGVVEVIDPVGAVETMEVARIDLIFSHLTAEAATAEIPDHNFVFGEAFRNVLASSGIEVPSGV